MSSMWRKCFVLVLVMGVCVSAGANVVESAPFNNTSYWIEAWGVYPTAAVNGPEGDGVVGTLTADGHAQAMGAIVLDTYPLTLEFVLQVEPGVASTRIALREDSVGDQISLQFSHNAWTAGQEGLEVIYETPTAYVQPLTTGLTFAAGDWARLTLEIPSSGGIEVMIEKWDGTAFGTPYSETVTDINGAAAADIPRVGRRIYAQFFTAGGEQTTHVDYLSFTQFSVPATAGFWDTYALRVSTPPTINGTINPAEYGDFPYQFEITNADITAEGSRTGSEVPDTDISATWYFAWDDTNLYVAAIVKDETVVYNQDEPNALNGTDGIQLCTNHENLAAAGVGSDDGIFILDLVPGQASDNNSPGFYQHWPEGARNTFPNVTYGGRTTADGYEVEMAIPWSDFTPSVPSFTVGDSMGYAALLMDYEDASTLENLVGATPSWPWALATGDWPVMTFIDSAAAMDYDGDGLTNAEEDALGTDPWDADTDNDGLSDYDEVHVYGTDPLLADTDGDGVSDGEEVAAGSDPLDPNDFPAFPASSVWAIAALLGLLALAATVVTVRVTRS